MREDERERTEVSETRRDEISLSALRDRTHYSESVETPRTSVLRSWNLSRALLNERISVGQTKLVRRKKAAGKKEEINC